MYERIQRMSSYKAQVVKYGTPISKGLYQELFAYAENRNIKLSGFKDFVGDIEIIKQVVDDIDIISKDFPLILDEKSAVVLELDYNLGTDFATTQFGHIIHLNAVYFSNLQILIDDYNEGVEEGRFVKGTDWHSVIKHEIGHVVAHVYHLNPMEIAMSLLNTKSRLRVLDELTDTLSIYSTEYEDGREIISECFSGYYSNSNNSFSKMFVEECKNIISKGGVLL